MSNKREKLWRGIRSLIQTTSEEMAALDAAAPAEPARAPEKQTVLPFPRRPEAEPPQAPPRPPVGTGVIIAPELANPNARRGVCTYFYENHDCWLIPEAYSNTGLHVCMMRECPVYELHKEVLEKRFAERFRHLW